MSTANPFATPIASTGNLASDIEGVNNAASGPSQAASPYNEKQSEAGKASLFRKPKAIGLAIFAVVAVIALGVGLGVGLRKKPATELPLTGTPNKLNGGSPASSSVSAPSPTATFKTPRTLIDSDTPKSAFSIAPINNGAEMTLVFSDEFNSDSRTFGEGDEPYWTAENLHDWQTNQMVYYDPSAITTKNGSLEISLTKQSINGYEYKSGMLSSWNKFCFTGGRIEARVQLPGADNVLGLWPSIYAVGNLARAGYAASTDGVWPYSYDSCDIGTVANQSINGLPTASVTGGDPFSGGALSWQPGQRLSRCTCSDETHPGPKHADGSFVGRGAPEIDMFEGVASRTGGIVTQSAQIAPFNAGYYARNTSSDIIVVDSKLSSSNAYRGGVMQQSISVNTQTDQAAYQLTGGSFSVFGFEYKSGFDSAYITWISGGKATWSLMSSALSADPMTEISSRPVSQEPMYLVMSLGMSQNFGMVDLEHLAFPAVMRIDYVRVYQAKDAVKITCDPTDFPTAAYIEKYKKAYTDPKLTTWKEATGQAFPKNQLVNGC